MFFMSTAPSSAFAEIYTWTDDNGVINFTDYPSQATQRVKPSVRTDKRIPPPDLADIVGSWSNEQNEFKTLNCIFQQDQSGFMVTAIGMRVPFNWRLLDGGTIELAFVDLESGRNKSGATKTKDRRAIRADYDKQTDTIQLRGEDNTAISTLFRIENAEFKVKKRREFKRKDMYATDRFVFSDLTAYDLVTKLTWTRDGDLAQNGDVVTFSNAKRLIEDLNKRQYGGFNDWRLPNLQELQELARFGRGFYHETSPNANRKNWGVASVFNGMGFFGIKPFYYWTSTTHSEYKGNIYCVSLSYGSDTYNIDYYTRHVWPVRGQK